MKDPFDRVEKAKLFGNWVAMGYLSEDWFIANIAETAKALLEQMKRSVKPIGDVTLVFTLEKIPGEETYRCTGAWKCLADAKEEKIIERKTGAESGE